MKNAIFSVPLCLLFLINSVIPFPQAHAEQIHLPAPGAMVHLSPKFTPAHLKGIIIHPKEPFKFDFIIHRGDQPLSEAQKKEEYTKLVKYFLASLAIPDQDQWVNLSPYEGDRMVNDNFGKTIMGRDLLAQDYILKQITASLIYPQTQLGKAFWDRVYTEARKKYGAAHIPINTFNKVWVLPSDALIYQKGHTAYILKNHLRVMLEEDYISLHKHSSLGKPASNSSTMASKIVREIVLPELQKEINEGKNFAPLRQVYSGMLLAAWFKRTLRESLLGGIYADKVKVNGVDHDPKINKQIYEKYLNAYKKGVFNLIQEDKDELTHQNLPRKYFSGGMAAYPVDPAMFAKTVQITSDLTQLARVKDDLRSDDMAAVSMVGVYDPEAGEEQVSVVPDLLRIPPAVMVPKSALSRLTTSELDELRRLNISDQTIIDTLESPPRTGQLSFGFTVQDITYAVDQRELITHDFVETIRIKERQGKNEINIYQIGIGAYEPIETREIIQSLDQAFKRAGVQPNGWTVNFVAVDFDPKIVQKFLTASRFKASYNLKLFVVEADTLNAAAMDSLGRLHKGDYIFHRNTTYANFLASIGGLNIDATNIRRVLNAYLSIKNVLKHLAQLGTKYVLEPSIDDARHIVNVPGTNVVPSPLYRRGQGRSIITHGTGIYEVYDPQALSRSGINALNQRDAAMAAVPGSDSMVRLVNGAEASTHDIDLLFQVLMRLRSRGIFVMVPKGNIVRYERPQDVSKEDWETFWNTVKVNFPSTRFSIKTDDYVEGWFPPWSLRIFYPSLSIITHVLKEIEGAIIPTRQTIPIDYANDTTEVVEKDFRDRLNAWIGNGEGMIPIENFHVDEKKFLQEFLAGRKSIPNLGKILEASYAHLFRSKSTIMNWYLHLPTVPSPHPEGSADNILEWRERGDLYQIAFRNLPERISIQDWQYIESEMSRIDPKRIKRNAHAENRELNTLRNSIFTYFYSGLAQAVAQFISKNPQFRAGGPTVDAVMNMDAIKRGVLKHNPELENSYADFVGLVKGFFKTSDSRVKEDRAMAAIPGSRPSQTIDKLGGIDMNAAHLSLNVQNNGGQRDLLFSDMDVRRYESIKGLTPVILSITPAAQEHF